MRSLVLTLGALLIAAAPTWAAPVGTAFSYQGQLLKSGSPYQGNADGIFRLFDAASAGNQVGSTITLTAFPVTGGLFTVDLDFGSVFNTTALWLDIQVRTPPDAGFTAMTTRVRLSASPFALFAMGAPGSGASQWISDPFGIHYDAGNVGLGAAGQSSHGGVKLYINTGTANLNPLWVLNDNVNKSALYTANTAANGLGWVDDQSDRHYVQGRIGVGTVTPDGRSKIHAVGTTVPIWGEATGNSLVTGYQCGVYGVGLRGTGPLGPADPAGVIGAADFGTGVAGITTNSGNGVTGQNNTTGNIGYLGGPGIGCAGRAVRASDFGGYFENTAGGVALRAIGLAQVNTLQILGGADIAEPFDVSATRGVEAEPGTVVIIDSDRPGELRVSDRSYDDRVAGVISGANAVAPGMVLKAEGNELADGDHPVALTGRVWCKVDASFGAVSPGDLLTTSETAGHAMKAADLGRRAGAVIGKAMTSLEAGRGLVLVLVSLQ
jgi:hypothetical protein